MTNACSALVLRLATYKLKSQTDVPWKVASLLAFKRSHDACSYLNSESFADHSAARLMPGPVARLPLEGVIRAAAGLHTFADFNQLLELLPRSLAHYLRVSAIVRASASRLGATVYDRMRINAAAAVRGALSFARKARVHSEHQWPCNYGCADCVLQLGYGTAMNATCE